MSGVAELWHIIRQSLALDLDLWRDLVTNPDALRFRYALWIVVLAGLAEAVAQSAVLFMNQVRPLRFVLSLLINAVIFAFGYFFYVLSIGFIADVFYGVERETDLLFVSVALAYAPLVLSFLTLIPYFGRAVTFVLSAYHFLALLIAVGVTYGLEMPKPALCVAGGWLLLTLLRGTVGRPVTWLARFVRNRFAGRRLLDAKSIRQRYLERRGGEDKG